jgi:hypothetical protein
MGTTSYWLRATIVCAVLAAVSAASAAQPPVAGKQVRFEQGY